jgi:hypothetical protein
MPVGCAWQAADDGPHGGPKPAAHFGTRPFYLGRGGALLVAVGGGLCLCLSSRVLTIRLEGGFAGADGGVVSSRTWQTPTKAPTRDPSQSPSRAPSDVRPVGYRLRNETAESSITLALPPRGRARRLRPAGLPAIRPPGGLPTTPPSAPPRTPPWTPLSHRVSARTCLCALYMHGRYTRALMTPT